MTKSKNIYNRQQKYKEVYNFILEYKTINNGISPSLRDIVYSTGISLTNVNAILKSLEQDGMIIILKNKGKPISRAIDIPNSVWIVQRETFDSVSALLSQRNIIARHIIDTEIEQGENLNTISKKTGIPYAVLHHWYKGNRNVKADSLIKLATALDYTVEVSLHKNCRTQKNDKDVEEIKKKLKGGK